ncbi:MAG: hypothetical protein HQK88_12830 [Nitrospirae bacterium]|nr:hypothetical protein [Nitrospirota bacterium]MBF0519241.1 hypothetical protein [Nitrospirota bacterium]MBF0535773.1 hypothetical protein [Nitrospirota bacterium]MBF0617686.1 hypothetical protein [Nitrospirota bacterium]
MDYQIKESFPISDWEIIKTFITQRYRADHALCFKPFFEWQFQVRKNKDFASIICAYEGKHLMGTLGYLPLELHWGSLTKQTLGVWLLHWMVSPEAPKGLGILMLKRIQKMFALCLTLNSSQFGSPILQAMGWKYFPNLPRYIIVMDKTHCKPLLYEDTDPEQLNSYTLKADLPTSEDSLESHLSDDNYRPDWTHYPEMQYATVRSFEYLQWRYMEHPSFKYYFFKSRSKTTPAMCVLRIEKSFGKACVTVGKVVDFFYPTDDRGISEASAVLSSALLFCRQRECAYVEFKCCQAEYAEMFMKFGGALEPHDRAILISRLMPIQHLHRNTNVSYLSKVNNHAPQLNQMYITKSDIDDDSPSSVSVASQLIVLT